MNDWPKISIVTPSFNQAVFLERTIQSVLSQDYPNLEYIIIDGGSTDGSVDIIKKYAGKLAYWVSEKDNGQTHAINKGFRRASGDIVAWLNSDDEYCPGALKTVARTFMEDKELDVVFGNRLTIDENENILRDDRHTRYTFAALVLYGMIISQPAAFWKRRLLEQFGYLDESMRFAMDYEFFCRIGEHIKTKHVRMHFAKFRRQSSSKTSNIIDVGRAEHRQISEKYLKEACKGWPVKLVILSVFAQRTFWYILQGDGLYVLKGFVRRLLPESLRPQWM
jgi:glycosyltransferase involved in cell wall biosynthesis